MLNSYYVYVDTTNDGHSYYVGKGRMKRTKNLQRNVIHTRIALKYGQIRTIVFESENEEEAFNEEIRLIKDLHTHITEGGANLTYGGEGFSGLIFTDNHRKSLSEALKRYFEDEQVKIEHGKRSANRSVETKKKISQKLTGRKQSQQEKQKRRESMKRAWDNGKMHFDKQQIADKVKNHWRSLTEDERLARRKAISDGMKKRNASRKE